MKSAALVPRGNERGPITARALRVHVSGAVTCVVARQGLVAEGLLTAAEDETLDLDVYGGEYRTAWLARDNPFLSEAQRSKLDERGVIRPGTVVVLDDILMSALETDLPKRGRVTRPGMAGVRDDSLSAPPHWAGATVMECQILGRRELGARVPLNVRHRVRVCLHLEHPLAIGDLLVTFGNKLLNSSLESRDENPVGDILGVVGEILGTRLR